MGHPAVELLGCRTLQCALEPHECSIDSLAHWRQILLNGVPDDPVIDAVIDMAQDVSQTPDVLPVWSGAEGIGLVTEPDGGLRDDLELTLHGRSCLPVGQVGFEIHVDEIAADVLDALQDVPEMRPGISRTRQWTLRAPAYGRGLSSIQARTDRLRLRGGR